MSPSLSVEWKPAFKASPPLKWHRRRRRQCLSLRSNWRVSTSSSYPRSCPKMFQLKTAGRRKLSSISAKKAKFPTSNHNRRRLSLPTRTTKTMSVLRTLRKKKYGTEHWLILSLINFNTLQRRLHAWLCCNRLSLRWLSVAWVRNSLSCPPPLEFFKSTNCRGQ